MVIVLYPSINYPISNNGEALINILGKDVKAMHAELCASALQELLLFFLAFLMRNISTFSYSLVSWKKNCVHTHTHTLINLTIIVVVMSVCWNSKGRFCPRIQKFT
jgi:hypothetical protein